MIRDAPLLGVGPGTFRLRYGTYLGWPEWDERIHANNTYLEIGATTGIVGLAVFLFVTLYAIWRQLRNLVTRSSAPAWLLSAGSGGRCRGLRRARRGRLFPRLHRNARACTGRSWASALAWLSGSDAPPHQADVEQLHQRAAHAQVGAPQRAALDCVALPAVAGLGTPCRKVTADDLAQLGDLRRELRGQPRSQRRVHLCRCALVLLTLTSASLHPVRQRIAPQPAEQRHAAAGGGAKIMLLDAARARLLVRVVDGQVDLVGRVDASGIRASTR